MKRNLLSLFLSFFLTGSIFAQDWNAAAEPGDISTVNEAADMADKIVKAAGLKANFRIAEANVPNAMAVVHNGQRFILYNPGFVKALNKVTGTEWAAVSVLAHEIGHHLFVNSVNKGKTSLATELEADQFSGYVLEKMGATLSEAQAAMRMLGTTYATKTHPARDDRMGSIALGWKNAGGILAESDETYASGGRTERRYDEQVYDRRETAVTTNDTGNSFLASVQFISDPYAKYYLTRKLTLVRLTGNGEKAIGKLTRSDDEDFPFIISDGTGYRIFVNNYGEIYSLQGRFVGKLTMEENENNL